MEDVACQLLICVAGAPQTSTPQGKPSHNSFSEDSIIPSVSISAIKLRTDIRSKLEKEKKWGLQHLPLSMPLLPLLLLIDPSASQNWDCLHSREDLAFALVVEMGVPIWGCLCS